MINYWICFFKVTSHQYIENSWTQILLFITKLKKIYTPIIIILYNKTTVLTSKGSIECQLSDERSGERKL